MDKLVRRAAIFDMDGTLADVRPIRHLVQGTPRNFDLFHELSVDMQPNHWVAQLARVMSQDMDIVVVTARKHKWRHVTAWFLALNNIPSDALFMRHNNDNRPDAEVKQDILDRIRQSWDVVIAVDDNPNVIEMWRNNGIPVIVVEQ